MNDAVKAIPPPETDIQYMILIIVIGIVALILGWKFLDLKYGKKSTSENCGIHSAQIKSLKEGQDDQWEHLGQLRQDMNNQAVETEKAFGKMFGDMLEKMENHLDKRDERLEKTMNSSFQTMEKGLVAKMQITFRPMVEDAVQEALRRRRSSDSIE